MAEFHTLLMGAEVDVLPGDADEFRGTGIVCAAWLLKPGPDPMTLPMYSVLFANGVIATMVPPDRLRVVKIVALPSVALLNRDGDA